MSNQVQFVVQLDVTDLARFKEIAAACTEKVKAGEPETLAYTWNLSADGTKCVILEWYPSSAVVPAHLALVGPLLKQMESCAKIASLTILGKVEGEARTMLESMGASIYDLSVGFTRCGKACG